MCKPLVFIVERSPRHPPNHNGPSSVQMRIGEILGELREDIEEMRVNSGRFRESMREGPVELSQSFDRFGINKNQTIIHPSGHYVHNSRSNIVIHIRYQ